MRVPGQPAPALPTRLSATLLRAGALLALSLLAGCTVRRAGPPEPAGAATLLVYLDGATHGRLALAGAAAVAEDGSRVPLTLVLASIDPAQPRRQRLLARGALAPGTYRGLEVDVAGPSATVPVAVAGTESLSVAADGASMLLVRQQEGDQPAFAAAAPGPLAPGLIAVTVGPGAPLLTVVHKLSGEVFAVRRTGAGPAAAVIEPGGRHVYVACAGADQVEVHDLARDLREPPFPLLAGDEPSAIALSADGRTLVTANTGSGTISVLDAPVLAPRFRVSVGLEPSFVVLARDGRRAFVVNRGADSISVVDLVRGEVVATVAVDASPQVAVLDPAGRRLYVGHRDSPYLAVLRANDLGIERRAYVGPGVVALAVEPRGGRLFLSRRGTGAIEVFDPQSLLPVDTLRAGADAIHLTVDPEGDRLWAALTRGGARAFRIVGGEPLSTTDLGTDPAWISVTGAP